MMRHQHRIKYTIINHSHRIWYTKPNGYPSQGHPTTQSGIFPHARDPATLLLRSHMITTSEMERRLARTPWWARPRDWIRDDPDLRGARDSSFEYTAGVLRDLVPGGLYLLRGPRRVGKSVEVKKTIQRLIDSGEDPRRILHVAADNLSAPDLRKMVDASNAVTRTEGPRFWFLDEITAITDGWPAEIKWLRDNDPRFSTDTVVLTGSSATGLDEAVKALAGRRGGAADSDRALERERAGTFLDFDGVLHHRSQTRKEIDFVGPHFGGVAIEAKYVSGHRWRRAMPTIRASRWRGIVATRDALDLRDPEVGAVPTGLLVWLIGG